MGFLSLPRPNKKAPVSLPKRSTSWFAPVLPDWLDSKTTPTFTSTCPSSTHSDTISKPRNRRTTTRSFSRILERWAFNFATTTDKTKSERTLPGNHPIGTPRTKNTGRRNVSPEAVMSLPPGAAAPTLGRVLDYDMNNAEFFSRPSIHFGTDDCGQSTIRCMSMSLDAFISGTHVSAHRNNHYRPSSTIMSHNMTGAPAIPPRSHLRAASSSYTTSSSTSSSPIASGRSSPTRPYVLDVAPPSSRFGQYCEPVEEIINFRPGPQRQVSYELPPRATHHKRASYDDHRDPLKVRDHRPPRKSSSGVYTPATFPGASHRPCPSQSLPSPAPSSVSQPTSPDTLYSWLRPRTLAGLKRVSSSDSTPVPPKTSQLDDRMSHYPRPSGLIYASVASSPPVSLPSTPRISSNGSYGSRSSHSPPSSTQSVTSVSPPTTPTTPMSLAVEHGIITIAGDSVDDIPTLDVDPTPKSSPRPNQISPAPSAERIVPLSPTAPKRARRKPAPRLDDDLSERLEAVKM
ncbi:hypothetical protein CcaverHIS002_0204690 [Cutaneotrichosporon cavernicola]|nr:hypothetical protein CcaverHIS002_0204690 [Cutaneotrichosporon cavernicola]